jgi:hypothetical protein
MFVCIESDKAEEIVEDRLCLFVSSPIRLKRSSKTGYTANRSPFSENVSLYATQCSPFSPNVIRCTSILKVEQRTPHTLVRLPRSLAAACSVYE